MYGVLDAGTSDHRQADASVTQTLEKVPVEQVLAKLTVQPDRGLSSAEAQQGAS